MYNVLTTQEAFNKEFKYYDQLHHEKYRDENQTKLDHFKQISLKLGSTELHQSELYDSLIAGRFLPAGRIQAAMGATEREVSPFNCSVSQRIDDSMVSIMDAVSNAAKVLRLGTGIGYNFSNLRPHGAEIKKLKTKSSGPLSFMKIFDVMASTIASSGHRRGAQMGIMNVSHPDIETFIDAKMVSGAYRQFNLSVGISDEFMAAVKANTDWPLSFAGKIYKTIPAAALWEKITRNAYLSAEPGIIFIDRLNNDNNLYYCEHIEATNPCAEQPLPPYGLCCLGSFNLVGYLRFNHSMVHFDYATFISDIYNWVEAYDNIFDQAVYAIPEHKQEALSKRRIGLGLTGIANAIEYLVGRPCYGEPAFILRLDVICKALRDHAYAASVGLAAQRSPFTLYMRDKYCDSKFISTLPDNIKEKIQEYGIRNSHLISYAPCGTISQCAYNVSSGVEPVFHYEMSRDVYMKDGQTNVTLKDYMWRHYGFRGKTLEQCSVEDHLAVAKTIQSYCDSSISKTVNVAPSCNYEEYSKIYIRAHELGLKGITVFRPTKIRGSVISNANVDPSLASCPNGACSM